MHKCIRASAVLVVCLVNGCSTLEVRDTYKPVGNEIALLDYKSDDVELRVGINPDTRFYSIGLLGIPFIPTYFKISDPTEISLAIALTLRHDHDFSFGSKPCLTVKTSTALCPYEVQVSAVGMFEDDGSTYPDKRKRWHKISNFYEAESRVLNLPGLAGTARISRERIYQHYGYTGTQKWDFLRVNVEYKYKCEGVCPKRLELNAEDLLAVGSLEIPKGTYSFEKVRQSDYRPTARVQ